jgi:hypothetical protein
MTQAQAVIETIDKLGGIATLNQINQHIFEIEECVWKSKTPFASIRRIVQLTKGIYKIKPGLYALESHRNQLENDGIMVQNEKCTWLCSRLLQYCIAFVFIMCHVPGF